MPFPFDCLFGDLFYENNHVSIYFVQIDVADLEVLTVAGDNTAVCSGLMITGLNGSGGVEELHTVYFKGFISAVLSLNRDLVYKIFNVSLYGLILTALICTDNSVVHIPLSAKTEDTPKKKKQRKDRA